MKKGNWNFVILCLLILSIVLQLLGINTCIAIYSIVIIYVWFLSDNKYEIEFLEYCLTRNMTYDKDSKIFYDNITRKKYTYEELYADYEKA